MIDTDKFVNTLQHPISFFVGTTLIETYPEHEKYIRELIEKFDKTLEIEHSDHLILKINGEEFDFGKIENHKIQEKDTLTFEREYSLNISRLYDDLPNTWDYRIYTSFGKIIVLSFYNFLVSHFSAGETFYYLL